MNQERPRPRALKATWIGAAMSFAMAECVGLWAALFPRAWPGLFGSDPAMLQTGAHHLRIVGPSYGFFGLGIVLYFASQGAGKLLWPVIGNIVRPGRGAGDLRWPERLNA